MNDKDLPVYFSFFNEIGIIDQLSSTLMEAQLPKGFLITHFGVLNHLTRLEEGSIPTPLSIAKAFQVPKASMTHTLSGLEKAGLIEMRANPNDGRSKLVQITEAGRQFRMDAIYRLAPKIAQFSETFPVEKIAAVLPLLSDIRSYLDEERN